MKRLETLILPACFTKKRWKKNRMHRPFPARHAGSGGGRLEGAIPHFIRSAELDPGNSAVGEALVKTYTALEDVPAAFAAALILLQHDPLVLDFKELFELAVTEESVQLVSKTLDAVADRCRKNGCLSARRIARKKKDAWRKRKTCSSRPKS
ncbi:hypothetical protein BB776_05745 [Planococcus salinarum]|uniref:Uncharacterized protein n=1 Tax=Planococcus salinarum TaxID=622695 RepID=A0ABX3D1B2_9BACL|nr:hypothetical protein BB776_05745 [Planococcus salinarum]